MILLPCCACLGEPTGFFAVVNQAGGAGNVIAAVRELMVPVPLEALA